jgi:hypothetical protein
MHFWECGVDRIVLLMTIWQIEIVLRARGLRMLKRQAQPEGSYVERNPNPLGSVHQYVPSNSSSSVPVLGRCYAARESGIIVPKTAQTPSLCSE